MGWEDDVNGMCFECKEGDLKAKVAMFLGMIGNLRRCFIGVSLYREMSFGFLLM